MRREYASIAAMAALLVGSQAVAIALSPLFQGSGYQAFPNPSDVTNTVVYVILILVFTAVILVLAREGRLLVPGAKEPEGSDRGGGGTGGDVHRARRSHHPRNHERLRIHVLDRAGPIVPRPRAECVRRRRDGPREPGGIFLPHAVRPQGQSASGAPAAERRRAPRLRAHEPPRVRVSEPRVRQVL